MKANRLQFHKITALSLILGTLAAIPANSQSITPNDDRTKTTVTQQGQEFNIEGGTRSGANLFHSFDKFNVDSQQTANFQTNKNIHNILGRVTGGASYINGLIQVLGGNSNLFLMNPAGVMFGPNARLNIPASFSVTTATGIGFDNNNFWFKAMGTNEYSKLVGDPSGYRFSVSNLGYIVNEGNLSLKAGESLTLSGGTVIDRGKLSSAGGNINVAAVEGGSILRISLPGHLLSLEIDSSMAASCGYVSECLTGKGIGSEATSVAFNKDGNVMLTGPNTMVVENPGTAILSGKIDVSTSSSSLEGREGSGSVGEVNVLADNDVIVNRGIKADSSVGLRAGRIFRVRFLFLREWRRH